MLNAAAVVAAITAFLELAKLEFAATPAVDQAKLAAIHAHILEKLANLLDKLGDDIQVGVDKIKSIVTAKTAS